MLAELKKSLAKIEKGANGRFLLTVSGGVDSMVLMELFSQLNLDFSVAHCNFQLRGEEANKDQLLVKQTAENLKVKFHTISFDTLGYKEKNRVSTQMAARELRYDWFNELRNNEAYDYIVTAHHLDDNVETVLLNLTRGTGIEGITGMKLVSDFIFRPMLRVSKKQIREFANTHNVDFREDKSNESNDYKRNKIRNKIIPIFQEMNPSFLETMGQNISHFESMNEVYKKGIEKRLSDFVVRTKGELFYIDILKIKDEVHMLYEFLKRFGFNYSQVVQINSLLSEGNGVGKYFYSSNHQLLIDRKELIISPREEKKNIVIEINKSEKSVTYPLNLSFNEEPKEKIELKLDSTQAFLDADKITYPLQLRKWKPGDSFRPFGMVGKKKVSDYLIDNKVSRVEKERTYVIESNGEIIWIVGQRISENYKISNSTNRVLNIILQ